MIEINKVTGEISALRRDLYRAAATKYEKNKIKKKIQFLTTIVRYLETFPSEEFIKTEISRLNKRVSMVKDQFKDYVRSKYFEKEKDKLKAYLKECGVPKLKLQLKALRFI